MIVCVCAGATEEDIKSLAYSFRTFDHMSESTGISDGCGSCLEQALEIFRSVKKEKKKKKSGS